MLLLPCLIQVVLVAKDAVQHYGMHHLLRRVGGAMIRQSTYNKVADSLQHYMIRPVGLGGLCPEHW